MSLFLFFCTFIIIPFTCPLREKSLSASELLVWRSFVGTEMNANGKYLISAGERAENNTLWREVAEGGDLGSRVYDLPPHRLPTDALLTGQALLVSHHEAAFPSLIKLPITLPAAQQGHEAPAERTLLRQRQKVQPHIANHPDPCHSSPFSIYFHPSGSWRDQSKP